MIKTRISTHDAVETAIDLSKKNSNSTWEEILSRNAGRIKGWATEEPIPADSCAANGEQLEQRSGSIVRR